MSKPKFTEGPLAVMQHSGDSYFVFGPIGIILASLPTGFSSDLKTGETYRVSLKEAGANASLYAASPDLYEAVRKAIQLATVAEDSNLYEVEIDDEMVDMLDLRKEFEAALKKAVGK